jgi:drug/metabolite transporter (DMT)-like permease
VVVAVAAGEPAGERRCLALGGVARVGQVQLLQTFFTLGASALLLGERVDTPTLIFAVATLSIVWRAQRERVRHPSDRR